MVNLEALLMALTALAVGVTDLGRISDSPPADQENLGSKLAVAHVEQDRDQETGRVVRIVTFGFDLREARGASGTPFVIREEHFNKRGELSERLTYRGRTWTWDDTRQLKVERRQYEVLALADSETPERFREVYLLNPSGEHFATEREVR